MKKIMFVIGLILIFGLLLNISGCIPAKEPAKEDEISELGDMEKDLNPDNIGDISKDIDDTVKW